MEFVDYIRLVGRRWLLVAVTTAIGVLAGFGATTVATPKYTAEAQMFVSTVASDSTSDLLQGSSFTIRQVRSYVQLVRSPQVLEPVITALGLDATPQALAEQITAQNPVDTVLINLRVVDSSPRAAAAIANAAAASLSTVVEHLETADGETRSMVRVSTVRPAVAEDLPASPNLRLNLAIGLVLGLFAGVSLAVIRELLDSRLRSVADIETLMGAPALATIPTAAGASPGPAVRHDPHSPLAEAFRRLRTRLQFLETDEPVHAIVVTSALPAEGRSTTAISLAVALADAGRRVALVDADLRRPSVARTVGLADSVGLTTVLSGRARADEAVQRYGDGHLDVLASGPVPHNPSELLGSPRMEALIDDLRRQYDVVLIDAPPLIPYSDAAILARRAGGALVVVGAGTTRRQQLRDAVASLASINAPMLGVVINRAPTRRGRDPYGHATPDIVGSPRPTDGRSSGDGVATTSSRPLRASRRSVQSTA